jgi:hypothetical protein
MQEENFQMEEDQWVEPQEYLSKKVALMAMEINKTIVL